MQVLLCFVELLNKIENIMLNLLFKLLVLIVIIYNYSDYFEVFDNYFNMIDCRIVL